MAIGCFLIDNREESDETGSMAKNEMTGPASFAGSIPFFNYR
jgi:hypothetical protein